MLIYYYTSRGAFFNSNIGQATAVATDMKGNDAEVVNLPQNLLLGVMLRALQLSSLQMMEGYCKNAFFYVVLAIAFCGYCFLY